MAGHHPRLDEMQRARSANRSATTTAITIRTGPGSGAAAVLQTLVERLE